MTTPTTTHRRPSARGATGRTSAGAWLGALAMVVVGVTVVALCIVGGLRTARGIELDQRMMLSLGESAEAWMRIVDVLTSVTVASVAVCLVGCTAVALMRGRLALAVGAVLLVAGANVSTQVLKHRVLDRVDDVTNSSPSGHTTVSLSLALAAVLVAPAAWRWLVVPLGGFAATFVAAGTIVGGWHRPSDVIAAVGVCLVWSAVAVTFVALAQRRRTVSETPSPHRHWLALLGSAATGLVFVGWGVRPADGDVDLGLAVVALGAIGVTVAGTIAWVGSYADRHLA